MNYPNLELERVFNSDLDCGQAGRRRGRPWHNFKRIRLRGDWSDTGPSAGTEDPVSTQPSNNRDTEAITIVTGYSEDNCAYFVFCNRYRSGTTHSALEFDASHGGRTDIDDEPRFSSHNFANQSC